MPDYQLTDDELADLNRNGSKLKAVILPAQVAKVLRLVDAPMLKVEDDAQIKLIATATDKAQAELEAINAEIARKQKTN